MNTLVNRISYDYGELIVAPINAGKSRTMLLDAIEYAKDGKLVYYITDEASVERTMEHMIHIYDGDFNKEVIPLPIELISLGYGKSKQYVIDLIKVAKDEQEDIAIMYDCPVRVLSELNDFEEELKGSNITFVATIQSKRPRGYDYEN